MELLLVRSGPVSSVVPLIVSPRGFSCNIDSIDCAVILSRPFGFAQGRLHRGGGRLGGNGGGRRRICEGPRFLMNLPVSHAFHAEMRGDMEKNVAENFSISLLRALLSASPRLRVKQVSARRAAI